MEILGIGPMELFFIVLLAMIILGPKDMVKAGRTLGVHAGRDSGPTTTGPCVVLEGN